MLVDRMTHRQILEAIAFTKSQRQGLMSARIGYDVFYDVFYCLGTFSEPFSRSEYINLSVRERHFAEKLWALL